MREAPLIFSTCQAPFMDATVARIVDYLTRATGLDSRFALPEAWEARQQGLDSGAIHVCWICGAPYAQRADARLPIELLAAPVPGGARYNDEAIYFSDVIVPAASNVRAFEDLHGARWGFNEPGSHSGYHVVRYTLAQRKLGSDFFGERVQTGGHAESLRRVAAGEIDGAAIDSTVLEGLLARQPELRDEIRVIDALGPSARPPWVIRKEVPVEQRAMLRKALATMHTTSEGAAILDGSSIVRFDIVTDRHYNGIRQMLRLADARGIW
jgi:phosphonate transport system substrate-binding protein